MSRKKGAQKAPEQTRQEDNVVLGDSGALVESPVVSPATSTPEPLDEAQVVDAVEIVEVAPGKALTTRARGIIGAGQRVTPADFSTGTARIDQLVAAGYLVRK